jgi:hypothetical protein
MSGATKGRRLQTSILCKGYHHLLRVDLVIHMKQIDRAKMKFLHMNQLRDVGEMRRFVAESAEL